LNILIVKLSSLGDVVHAMPAVQDLRQALPQARIDWVVEKGFSPLVQRCEGVRRVVPCELRRWRKAPFAAATRAQWRTFKAELQAEDYDAVIDLQGLSKSALVAWLARLAPGGRRYALANRTEGSGYEAPTRWVADVAVHVEPHVHAVQRSRILCARALGYELPPTETYGLHARFAHERVAVGMLAARPCVALVHGTSRADKQWPAEHWIALARRLDAAGCDVALLHGTDEEERRSQEMARAMPNALVWPRLALDALTDALAGCAGVIGVDSGLSHIAVALDLPHVQLYNFDTAWRTGPVERLRQRSVYAQPAPTVEAAWAEWLSVSGTT
jgi:heptosyltransferase I